MDKYGESVRRVQDALEQDCPLQPDAFLARKVISLAERPRAFTLRKLPAAAAIILALLLMAASAVAAALLLPHEVAEQTALPLALESGSAQIMPDFTQEELAAILRVAEENGVQLSEYWYRALEAPQGSPKDEVIKALAAAEFGDYMTWTIEEQHWFGEMMVAIGQWEENPYCLPAEGELSYAAALDAACACILERYGTDVSDASRWTLSVEYSDPAEPQWWFYFAPASLEDGAYEVFLAPDGTVISCIRRLFKDMTANEVQAAYSEVYGSVDLWSPETWASFGADLAAAAANEPAREVQKGSSLAFHCKLLAQYILPPAGSITKEEAERIALAAVGLEDTEVFVAFCCMDGDTPIWKVVTHTMRPEDIHSGRYTATWMVEMDCMTGEIRDLREWTYTDPAGMMYAPHSVYESLLQQLQ